MVSIKWEKKANLFYIVFKYTTHLALLLYHLIINDDNEKRTTDYVLTFVGSVNKRVIQNFACNLNEQKQNKKNIIKKNSK